MLRNWKARRAFDQALALESEGRFAEARDAFLGVAAELPGTQAAVALARAGTCSTWLGEFSVARKHFQAARDADPGNPDHWLNYANACQRLGDGMGADEAYVEALKRAPDRPDILYYQSVYYADKLTRGGLEGSRRAFRKLAEALETPGGPARMGELGFPWELPLAFIRNLALEKELVDDGVAALTEFVDRAPKNESTAWIRPAALNHRGLLLANAGRYDDAARDYETSLGIVPADHVTYNLGMVEMRRHRWDAARKALTEYSKRRPTSPVTTFGLALLAETKGDAKEAARLYPFFLERQSKTPASPTELMTLDVPRSWVNRAKGFLEALQKPSEGGYFEVE